MEPRLILLNQSVKKLQDKVRELLESHRPTELCCETTRDNTGYNVRVKGLRTLFVLKFSQIVFLKAFLSTVHAFCTCMLRHTRKILHFLDDLTVFASRKHQETSIKHLLKRKSSCANARGTPTAVYQVLHLLPYPAGGGGAYLGRGGVPTLVEGYLPWLGGYLPWPGGTYLGWGVPTSDR